MNATAKPRPDAKLKTLPEERQAQIADFARTHSLAQTVRWLRQDGLRTSISAVAKFLRYHRFREQLARNEATLQAAIADIVKNDPTATAERLHEVGNAFFAASALEQQDPRAWYFAQQTALRRAELRLKTLKSSRLFQPLVPSCTVLHPKQSSPA